VPAGTVMLTLPLAAAGTGREDVSSNTLHCNWA
jgi:hypothetical protein